MSTEMKIKALAPWFGGKRTLAPRIVAELGKHRVYWELFAGGMSVLLAKPQCVMETVNDLHGDLINLARVVQCDELAPVLFDRMSRTAMHETLAAESAARLKVREKTAATDIPDLDRATDYLLCSWLGRNGVAGTNSYNFGFCVRYTANGGNAAKRFRSMAESIPAWWDRLRNVTILNRHVRELLRVNSDGSTRIKDRAGTVIYADPPYFVKGAKYVHDFTSRTDDAGLFAGDEDRPMSHEELADGLRRFKHTRVVVSYYDHPAIRQLYKGWTFVDCAMTKSLVNQGMRDGAEQAIAPEVLIVNGPSNTAEGWKESA